MAGAHYRPAKNNRIKEKIRAPAKKQAVIQKDYSSVCFFDL
jgi:hypothetical protein